MENNKTYNGWTNYETWLVNLWFDDAFTDDAEQAFNDAEPCSTYTKKENAALSLKDSIEQTVRDSISEQMPQSSGLASDFIEASLSEVNWYEIALNYMSDLDCEAAS